MNKPRFLTKYYRVNTFIRDTMPLWGPCHSGGFSQWAAGQWWPCHSGAHVTVGSVAKVAMSLSGPYHSGQQVSGGHVTVGAMSRWAAGQWWPCHSGAM